MRRLSAILFILVVGISLLGSRSFRTYSVHTVLSGSMGKSAPAGSLVVVRAEPDYRLGDIILFAPLEKGETVVHRIVAAEYRQDVFTYQTKGDANPNGDGWTVPKDQVRGKVVGVVPLIGAVLLFLRTPLGFYSFAIVLFWMVVYPLMLSALRWQESLDQHSSKPVGGITRDPG
jgi:signal peptidase I